MSWIFQESDPMGGAAGEAYANTLKSPGMLPEHVLAREAIQNSVDAALEDSKVRVVFRHELLRGRKKAEFVSASGIKDIAQRGTQLELAKPNCLETLEESRKDLSLLYVEDHNAEGLSGEPHDSGSNFYRLLLSLGDRSKARTTRGTGGSYGFGKSVYSSSSAIQTIFAYTRFKDAAGEEHTRLFGCGYYQSHEYRKKRFSGRAWLGFQRGNDEAGRLVVDPYEGSRADSVARNLGFAQRAVGDLGTSILIVDATSDPKSIVAGVEDWWWPRLVEHKVDVDIFDAEANPLPPRPKKREHLRPFIEAFEIARGISTAKTGSQKLAPFNKQGETPLGACGLVVVPIDQKGSPIVRADWCNSVALVRGPLMVVAYQRCSDNQPLVVGAYVAPDAIDSVLRKSEPPAHDRWDPESANLRAENDSGRITVTTVLSRIRDNLRRFQREAAPPTPPKQRRLSMLERALGAYFRPQGAGIKVPPTSGTSPLHLEFSKQPQALATNDGMLALHSTFDVFIDPAASEDQLSLKLRISCPVLEDDGQEGEDLALRVKPKGVEVEADPEDAHLYRFTLAKGVKARFAIESESYDPAWTVRLHPQIEAEGGQ